MKNRAASGKRKEEEHTVCYKAAQVCLCISFDA